MVRKAFNAKIRDKVLRGFKEKFHSTINIDAHNYGPLYTTAVGLRNVNVKYNSQHKTSYTSTLTGILGW